MQYRHRPEVAKHVWGEREDHAPTFFEPRGVLNLELFHDGTFTTTCGALWGRWSVRIHPYELLDRMPDDITLILDQDCCSNTTLVAYRARVWARHLRPGSRHRWTQGVISVGSKTLGSFTAHLLQE